MLTLPGDIPLVTAGEIDAAARRASRRRPAFTIAPSHDERGSNAIICVAARRGAAALRRRQLLPASRRRPRPAASRPTVLRLPGHRPRYRQAGGSRAFCAARIAHASGPVARETCRRSPPPLSGCRECEPPSCAMPPQAGSFLSATRPPSRLGGARHDIRQILDRAATGARLSATTRRWRSPSAPISAR